MSGAVDTIPPAAPRDDGLSTVVSTRPLAPGWLSRYPWDDVRVLATSREPLRVAGEARYRLALTLPGADDPAGAESEAVTLFADRARRTDARFALDDGTRPVIGRLVTRLDGMPLAIELAAARVEALGVGQCTYSEGAVLSSR